MEVQESKLTSMIASIGSSVSLTSTYAHRALSYLRVWYSLPSCSCKEEPKAEEEGEEGGGGWESELGKSVGKGCM
jgi:hypothetical protein